MWGLSAHYRRRAQAHSGRASALSARSLLEATLCGAGAAVAASSLCPDNVYRPFGQQTFASRAALWCNALTSDEGLGLVTPQDANRSGLRH
jgi:hypothetical protein